jgi:ABC-type branched-subunit amino acid transport system permease subunit
LGGSNGIADVPRPGLGVPGLGPYFCALGLATVGLTWLMARLARGRFGWLLLLQSEDPWAAEALGYNVKHAKIAAIVVAGAVSAVAGAFYAPLVSIAYPAMFGVLPNMQVLVWLAIGGTGTLLGPFAAAVALTLIQFELGSQLIDWSMLIMGVCFVVAVVFAPEGVWRVVLRGRTVRRW